MIRLKKIGDFVNVEIDEDNDTVVYLNHSCDEWVIGNTEQAIEIATDITRAANWILSGECMLAVKAANEIKMR